MSAKKKEKKRVTTIVFDPNDLLKAGKRFTPVCVFRPFYTVPDLEFVQHVKSRIPYNYFIINNYQIARLLLSCVIVHTTVVIVSVVRRVKRTILFVVVENIIVPHVVVYTLSRQQIPFFFFFFYYLTTATTIRNIRSDTRRKS